MGWLFKLIELINVFALPNRLNRTKHFAVVGIYYWLLFIIVFMAKENILSMSPILKNLILLCFGIFYFVTFFLLTIKRLHDFNRSGWLSLLLWIPIIGWIWGLCMFLLSGTKGVNKFGPQPSKASKLECIIALLWIPILITILYCINEYSSLYSVS